MLPTEIVGNADAGLAGQCFLGELQAALRVAQTGELPAQVAVALRRIGDCRAGRESICGGPLAGRADGAGWESNASRGAQ